MTQMTYGCIPSIHFSSLFIVIAYSVFTCPVALLGGYLTKFTVKLERNEFNTQAPCVRKENPVQDFTKSSSFYFAVAGVAPFLYA